MNDDAELLALVRSVDPPPREVVAAARAAFGWRDPDAALAELTATAGYAPEPAAMRGEAPGGTLTFTGPGLTITLEADGESGDIAVSGRLEPQGAARVRIRRPDGPLPRATTSADAHGRFAFLDLPAGLFRLEVTHPDGSTAVTSWFRL